MVNTEENQVSSCLCGILNKEKRNFTSLIGNTEHLQLCFVDFSNSILAINDEGRHV